MRLFGTILPWVGVRKIPLNRDGSIVDTGEGDLTDEVGYYYVRLIAFEWFGFGLPIWQFGGGRVQLWATGEYVQLEESS